MRPTDKPKAHREAVYRDTEKSTEKSIEKSTSQVIPTSQKPTGMQSTETHWAVDREVYREVDRQSLPCRPRFFWSRLSKAQPEVDHKVHQAGQDSIEASFRERNYEVDRMVTKADFQRWLPRHAASMSQCHLLMNTGCKIYATEHTEAVHRAQTAQACLNLVSITIFRKAHLFDVH